MHAMELWTPARRLQAGHDVSTLANHSATQLLIVFAAQVFIPSHSPSLDGLQHRNMHSQIQRRWVLGLLVFLQLTWLPQAT